MNVLLTGSNGVIGTVLSNNLEYAITPYDLPDYDVRDYEQLVASARGHGAIVHLAWDTRTDNFRSDYHNPDNTLGTCNIYAAAVEANVGRVIMASSVHADKFTERTIAGMLDPSDVPLPDSPYGAAKVMMEALGSYYANAKGLGVVCVRFGGVNPSNIPPEGPLSERQVWFSHGDCVSLIDACLTALVLENNFEIVYGVSNNVDRIHDVRNSLGWQPLDGIV